MAHDIEILNNNDNINTKNKINKIKNNIEILNSENVNLKNENEKLEHKINELGKEIN